MRFLKQYGIAAAAVVLLVAAALITWVWQSARVMRADYYAMWIADDAALLSEETELRLMEVNQRLDQTYGSVIGLLTLPDLGGEPIADRAERALSSYGFGGNDLIVVLAVGERQWFLAYGDNLALYADNSLRQAVQARMTDGVYGADANAVMRTLYGELAAWLEAHVPPTPGQRYGRSYTTSGAAFLRAVLVFVLLIVVVVALIRYLLYPLTMLRRTGAWTPLWGWAPFGLLRAIAARRKRES